MNQKQQTEQICSPGQLIRHRFFADKTAVFGLLFAVLLILLAAFAPLIANGKPFFIVKDGVSAMPALRDFFAPDAQERFVETFFNYLMLLMVSGGCLFLIFLKNRRFYFRRILPVLAVCLVIPFCIMKPKMDRVNWRDAAHQAEAYCFAPVPYGPYETSSAIYEKPSSAHWFGTDQIGRDVFARMIYGARVSLAVGFFATLISLILGTLAGLYSGYKGGKIDLFGQRLVEIVICFPTFLLLLILMAIMLDYGTRQSILLVIAVLGFTSWPGLCRLVRGEVLKQRKMAYIQNCESLGVPLRTILFRHLLPNVSAPLFVSFAFDIAGAILAENSLSFLGFGVQDPTASWGELLRQAFSDPLTYWNLMLWPGLAIFLSVTAFNFIADGLRNALDQKI